MKSPHIKKTARSHPQSSQSLQHINLIETQIQKRMINPQQSTYCSCQICRTNFEIKQRGKAFLKQTSSNMKVQPIKMQQFLHLISAMNSKMYCRLDIPQICFFFKGEIKKLFKSNNTGVHQVQLTPVVRKNLANIFLQNKKINKTKPKSQQDTSFNFLTGQQHNDTHIKNFSSIIPSFKHGQKIDLNKPLTFIFHNDNNYQQDFNIMMSQTESQQICILKSKDKQFQLINQKQLRQILKSLLTLQNVEYIQTYIKPNQKQDQIYQANFSKTKGPQNQLMYNRSLTQIKVQINLINKYSKDYVSIQHLQGYQNLLKQIPQQYCLYQTYKMIHYMQLTKDVTIQKIGTLWLRNQTQELCFFGLADFKWFQNQKLSVDIGQIQQLKEIMNSEMTNFQQELLHAWENMKQRKLKPEEEQFIDIEKQQKIQQIKKQSTMRLAKQKERQKQRQRKSIRKAMQRITNQSNLSNY